MKFEKNEKVLFVRSAFLGDFLVCLPFINQIIVENHLILENVNFLILNNSGQNPIEIIFGKLHPFSKNTFVINTSSFKSIYSLKLNKQHKNTKVIYIPTWSETFFNHIKKYLLLKFKLGCFMKVNGFFKNDTTTVSQYLYPFKVFGIDFNKKLEPILLFNLRSKSNSNISKKVFIIYPNSKLEMKKWPVEKYVELIQTLIIDYECDIYLIGGNEDFDYNESLISKLGVKENIRNIAGMLNVRETLALMSRSTMFIGNDGFPMHLAAIADLDIIGLFTYKNPIGCWDPIIANKMITLRSDVLCKECFSASCINPICVTSISVENVVRSVNEIIDTNNEINLMKVYDTNKLRSKDNKLFK